MADVAAAIWYDVKGTPGGGWDGVEGHGDVCRDGGTRRRLALLPSSPPMLPCVYIDACDGGDGASFGGSPRSHGNSGDAATQGSDRGAAASPRGDRALPPSPAGGRADQVPQAAVSTDAWSTLSLTTRAVGRGRAPQRGSAGEEVVRQGRVPRWGVATPQQRYVQRRAVGGRQDVGGGVEKGASTTARTSAPARPAGARHRSAVPSAATPVTGVHGAPPRMAVGAAPNPRPPIVTVLPPPRRPRCGTTAVTVGGGAGAPPSSAATGGSGGGSGNDGGRSGNDGGGSGGGSGGDGGSSGNDGGDGGVGSDGGGGGGGGGGGVGGGGSTGT